jgi:hypothetical protein
MNSAHAEVEKNIKTVAVKTQITENKYLPFNRKNPQTISV